MGQYEMTDRHRKQQPEKRYLDRWFESAERGDIETLSDLLKSKCVSDVNIQDHRNRTALYLAAKRGKESCVTKLLDLGADPNSLSEDGTPAHAALISGQMQCLTVLLRCGADLKAKNHNQETLLKCINEKCSRSMAEKLLQETAEPGQTKRSEIPAHILQVLSLEVKSYGNNDVYLNIPLSYYIKGRLRGAYVTVKRYRLQVGRDIEHEQFHHELSALSDLRHPNILLLIAICISPDPSQQGLAFEPVERAFLGKLLHEDKTLLDEDTVLGISQDVARAMQFIHQRGYIHCFLGSDSVVLTDNFTAKICNFEYAQRVQHGDRGDNPISHLEILYDWMAPEQLNGKPADQPCDVFSFGILVWECITRKHPLKYVKSFKQLTKKTVDPRLQKIPTNWSQTFKILIGDCLKAAPKRPNFQQIYGWLSAIVTSQYVCLRPESFTVEKRDRLFPSRNSLKTLQIKKKST